MEEGGHQQHLLTKKTQKQKTTQTFLKANHLCVEAVFFFSNEFGISRKHPKSQP